jgi:hypothetical protein
MGVVVEYANKSGQPEWRQPPDTGRGSSRPAPQPDHQIEMKFGKIPGNRVDFNHWTITGKGFPDNGKIRLEKGNATGCCSTTIPAISIPCTCAGIT